MNKKIIAGVTALILMMSGGLCGCSNSKEENDLSDSEDLIKTTDTKNDNDDDSSEDTSADLELILNKDSLFREYLEEQSLCKISKQFNVTFDDSLKGNPHGLAGAVEYDFDNDKTDELVTFTFERNDTDGEDIRIDFLEVHGGRVEVEDSKYLTEIIDQSVRYDKSEANTIYKWAGTIEIVTSEIDGKMYFGSMFSRATDDFQRGGDTYAAFSTFAIEDGKITVLSNGCECSGIEPYVYSSLLPPSLRDSTDTTGLIEEKNGKEEILLYSSSQVEGEKGVFTSIQSSFSSLLNDFGLDLEYGGDETEDPDYQFVSKNHSEVKRIIYTQWLVNDLHTSIDNHDYYAGIKLLLDSDLEEILGVENPFDNYADETEYYKDILTYTHYYPEIWNYFRNDNNSYSDCEYSIFDMNNDGKKELIIKNYGDFSVIKPDSTIITIEDIDGIYSGRNFIFYDNGLVESSDIVYDFKEGHNVNGIYMNVNSGEIFYTSYDENTNGYHLKSNIDQSFEINGKEMDKKIFELKSGDCLIPEFHNAGDVKYQNTFVIEDSSNLKFDNYQDAYKAEIERLRADNEKKDFSYSLIYLDDDNIPEICINYSSTYTGSVQSLYTFSNSNVHHIYSGVIAAAGGLRCGIDGYSEKKGILNLNSTDAFGRHLDNIIVKYDYRDFTNLCSSYLEGEDGIAFSGEGKIDKAKYIVNDSETTKDKYNQESKKYSDSFKEIDLLYTYDEITKVLNGEK